MRAVALYAAISAATLFGLHAATEDQSPLVPVVYAQDPPPAPVGPSIELPAKVQGDVGAFIKVAAKTNGREVRWFAATAGLNVFPGELLRDSRSTVVTATAAGEYRLIAYTALADVPSDPVATIIVVGTPPNPPPGPGPGPGPNPPAPTDPLAKQMVAWLAPVKAQLNKQILADLAKNYESIAAEAVAVQGTLTKSGFVAATQTQNVRVLGPELALAMRDPFFVPLAKYMQSKNLAESDEAGHAALWRETAAAIQAAAATL